MNPLTQSSSLSDRLWRLVALSLASLPGVVILWIFLTILALALRKIGWSDLGLFTAAEWIPSRGQFGARSLFCGTLVTSCIAVLISAPLSLITAVFLTEFAPPNFRKPATALMDFIAAIPSIVLGLWGVQVFLPWIQSHPLLAGLTTSAFWPSCVFVNAEGSLLPTGVLCGLLITPMITSRGCSILERLAPEWRQGAFALGGTRWDFVQIVALRYARRPFAGAVLLGATRVLGEVIVVTLFLRSYADSFHAKFVSGQTLASLLATEFNAVTGPGHLRTLFQVTLILLILAAALATFARHLLQNAEGETRPEPDVFIPSSTRAANSGQGSRSRQQWRHIVSSSASFLMFWRSQFAALKRKGVWLQPKRRILQAAITGGSLLVLGSSTFWLGQAFAVALESMGHLWSSPAPSLNAVSLHSVGRAAATSLAMLSAALGMSIPIGLFGAAFLVEKHPSLLCHWIRHAANALQDLPGLFWGMALFGLLTLTNGVYASWVGVITLALILVPSILRSSEEALREVPPCYREGGLALGVARWKIAFFITGRAASPRIAQGILLAAARGLGMTTPLLFATSVPRLSQASWDVTSDVLPLHIFQLALSPLPQAQHEAWACVAVLLLLVAAIHALAWILGRGYQRRTLSSL